MSRVRGDRHSKQAGVGILISVTAVGVGSKPLVRSYSDHVLMWQNTKCGNRCCRGGACVQALVARCGNRAKVVEQWALHLEAMNKQLPHLGPPW